MNLDLLKNKYKNLVPQNKERFLEDLKYVKKSLNFGLINKDPILIYNSGKRRAFYYTLCIHLALKRKRLLDYESMTSRQLIDQRLEEKEKKTARYRLMFTEELSLISIHMSDGTFPLLEDVIIDLVENRSLNGDITVIFVDTSDGLPKTGKIRKYFEENYFPIMEIGNSIKSSPTIANSNKPNPKKKDTGGAANDPIG